MSLAGCAPITFIITANRKVAEAFYGETLGLPLRRDDGFAAVFDLAGVALRVTEVPGHVPSAHPVLGWQVADIVATATALTARGVKFTIYDGMGQDALGIWTAPDGSAKVAFFNDPDGNALSLTQG
ncbi:VOC family protein [Polymorphobacter arshaanensis]|uniref:VOC family protein n=1 Tax=Glacieibacterium arshaanense TaxID=2511025 RepID=A0A4Y9EQ66_9SPHN|nr:VOC family protein [Polymorphobacter arshaanensis]TFU05734.1 VOC family protein [Polymorphobacter arshaanensis]